MRKNPLKIEEENRPVRHIVLKENEDGTFSSTPVSQNLSSKKRKKKWTWSNAFSKLFLLIGILVLLWPVAAHLLKKQMITGEIKEYRTKIEEKIKDQDYLQKNQDYNKKLLESGGFYSDAPSVLDALIETDPIAKITIPKIALELPVYYGETEATLRKSVAVLKNTSMPFGGEGTHTVITGHRGMSDADLFLYINRLEPGDHIYLDNGLKELSYKVTGQEFIEPNDTRHLKLEKDKDQITLLTCDPPFLNYQRLLVHALRDKKDEMLRANSDFKTGELYGEALGFSPYAKKERATKWDLFLHELKNTNPYFFLTPLIVLIFLGVKLFLFLLKKRKKKPSKNTSI